MEYDQLCINCLHRPHIGKACPYCPPDTKDDPNARCKEFVRADIYVARSMARIEQGLMQYHGQLMMGLSTIFDLLAEAYPQAAESLDTKLKTRQKAAEEAIEMQRAQALAEADQALAAAKEAEERRNLDAVVEGYMKPKDNLLQFPVPETAEPAKDPEEVA